MAEQFLLWTFYTKGHVSCQQNIFCAKKTCSKYAEFQCQRCGTDCSILSDRRICRFAPNIFISCFAPNCIAYTISHGGEMNTDISCDSAANAATDQSPQ